jgi:predicted ester cyclase/ribosomal protein S18 acetylase RimI-like enzyme
VDGHCLGHRVLIQRYYEEMWNRWDFNLAEVLLDPKIQFRGSLGVEVRGVAGFQGYMRTVQAAFPDFTNSIDELIVEDDRVAARLTYRGTHRGELFGVAPSGNRIEYGGAAFFEIAAGRVARGWVLGDTTSLKKQLGAGLEIAAATLDDREWAAELMASTEPWTTLQVSLEICRARCTDPQYLVFVARFGDERCGFVVLQERGVAGFPYVKTLAVTAERRSEGVGRRLLAFAEDHFRGRSQHIYMCVSSFNTRARSLYERMGWVKVGELPTFVIPGATEILLHKRLD